MPHHVQERVQSWGGDAVHLTTANDKSQAQKARPSTNKSRRQEVVPVGEEMDQEYRAEAGRAAVETPSLRVKTGLWSTVPRTRRKQTKHPGLPPFSLPDCDRQKRRWCPIVHASFPLSGFVCSPFVSSRCRRFLAAAPPLPCAALRTRAGVLLLHHSAGFLDSHHPCSRKAQQWEFHTHPASVAV